MISFIGQPASKVGRYSREEGLVEGAFVKLVYTVNTAHGGQVAEDDLVGANTDDGAVSLEESLDSHALLEASDVGIYQLYWLFDS